MLFVTLQTCLSEPTTEICMKTDPLAEKCSQGNLVSTNIMVYVDIRGDSLEIEGRQMRAGSLKDGSFRFFRSLILPNFHMATIIILYYDSHLLAFQRHRNR